MRRLRRISAFLLGTAISVLTASGMALFLIYRPEPPSGADLDSADRAAEAFRQAHEVSIYAAGVTLALYVLGLLGTSSLLNLRTSARLVGLALSFAAVLVTGAAIAWDRLAYTGPRDGLDDLSGYVPIFLDDDVLFAVVDGTEVEPLRLAVWSAAHVFAVVVLVAFAFVRRSRLDDELPAPDDTSADVDPGRI